MTKAIGSHEAAGALELLEAAIPSRGEISLPHRFGTTTLLERIGAGGMAEVFLAEHEGLAGFKKRVVVKRILRRFANDPSYVQMFLREARVAASLNHAHLAQVFDIGVDDGDWYMVMEHVDGPSLKRLGLFARRAGAPLPVDACCQIIAEAARGLHAMHEARAPDGAPLGLVHRDISPENLAVTKDGVTKVLDFGIAKGATTETLTAAGQIKGKVSYMSPEQIRQRALSGASDVFSLGVTFYWALTGQKPFHGATHLDLFESILSSTPPRPSTLDDRVPEDVDDIVMGMLAKEARDRLNAAAAFKELVRVAPPDVSRCADLVRRFVDGDDNAEEPTEDITPSGRPPRRGPTRLVRVVTPFASSTISSHEPTPSTSAADDRRPTFLWPDPRPTLLVADVHTITAPVLTPASSTRAPVRRPQPPHRRGRAPWLGAFVGAGIAFAFAVVVVTVAGRTASRTPSASFDGHASGTAHAVDVAPAAPHPDDGAHDMASREGSVDDVARNFALAEHGVGARDTTSSERGVDAGARKTASAERGVDDVRAAERRVAVNRAATRGHSAAPAKGTLAVRVIPYARVTIDGIAVGETPLAPVTLSAGRHTVLLVADDVEQTRIVDVAAGENAVLKVALPVPR